MAILKATSDDNKELSWTLRPSRAIESNFVTSFPQNHFYFIFQRKKDQQHANDSSSKHKEKQIKLAISEIIEHWTQKFFFLWFTTNTLHPRHISEKSNCSRRPQTNWFFFRSSLKPDKRKNIPSKHWINVHISMILPSKMLKTKRTQPYYPFFEITSTYHKEGVKKYTNTLRMILGKLNTKSPITDTTWS